MYIYRKTYVYVYTHVYIYNCICIYNICICVYIYIYVQEYISLYIILYHTHACNVTKNVDMRRSLWVGPNMRDDNASTTLAH